MRSRFFLFLSFFLSLCFLSSQLNVHLDPSAQIFNVHPVSSSRTSALCWLPPRGTTASENANTAKSKKVRVPPNFNSFVLFCLVSFPTPRISPFSLFSLYLSLLSYHPPISLHHLFRLYFSLISPLSLSLSLLVLPALVPWNH